MSPQISEPPQVIRRCLVLAAALLSSGIAAGATEKLTLAGVETGETVATMTARQFAGVDHPLRYLSTFGPYKERTVRLGQYLIGFQAPIKIMGNLAISNMETIGIVGDGVPFLQADPLSQSTVDFQLLKAWYAAHEASTIVRVSLSFATSAYADLATAATAKYGKPDQEGSERVSNAMGAMYLSRFLEWKDTHGNVLRLAERSGKVDVCEFTLTNTSSFTVQEQRIQATLLQNSGL